jgi:hypothetical protein
MGTKRKKCLPWTTYNPEQTFNEFVTGFGGELAEKLIPDNNGVKRADYLFRSPPVIAELKTLEQPVDVADHQRQLQVLAEDWQRRGLIPIRIGGRFQIALRTLPKICQNEWMEIYEGPLQKQIFRDANRQIRETKQFLGINDAKGVLLLNNERPSYIGPLDYVTFAARILNKKKSNGESLFSSIHRVVFFSVNLPITSPEYPNGAMVWMPAYRAGETDEPTGTFLQNLGTAWLAFLGQKRGNAQTEVIKSTRAPSNQ